MDSSRTSKFDLGWLGMSRRSRRRSARESMELAFTDMPLLCCDDDRLCPACRAATSPELAAIAS